LKKTNSEQNDRKIRRFLKRLEGVSVSKNYKEDLAHCKKKLEHYQLILQWCEIFLDKKSFSIYSGTYIASALLFPMERLFESYMARKVRQTLPKERYRVVVQENKYSLFERPQPAFRLRPDIVIYDLQEHLVYILDTKWKILSKDKKNYGILSSDMYQIYAYQKRYQAEKVILLYPQVEEEKLENIYYEEKVEVVFVDL
jgi:5-methylcytosine-specific restriction enzyme subunit McrC